MSISVANTPFSQHPFRMKKLSAIGEKGCKIDLKRIQLGDLDLKVTEVCLGCTTFGPKNTESESHAILDRAFERCVNFIDSAKGYPVDSRVSTAETSSTIMEIG